MIVGLTSYVTKGHLAREVVDAMDADSGLRLSTLRVDGGMTADHLLMQILADTLDVPVIRPMSARRCPSAPRTPRASRSATGPTSTGCAATGTAPGNGCRRWTRSAARTRRRRVRRRRRLQLNMSRLDRAPAASVEVFEADPCSVADVAGDPCHATAPLAVPLAWLQRAVGTLSLTETAGTWRHLSLSKPFNQGL